VYDAGFEDEGDWGDEMGYQSDPAYEQYAERLQQQLESLRKEHDEIFGRADTNKVLMFAAQAVPLIQRAFMLLNLCRIGLADVWLRLVQDGAMSGTEYYAMHREAEQGDDKNKYDDKELENAFADLDKDGSASLSLDEWRRPFEEHTDAWLQVFSCDELCARARAHHIQFTL
jgi:hypothetical protein